MRAYCGHCKANGHWGDECPNRPVTKSSEPAVTKSTHVTKSNHGGKRAGAGRPRLHESNAARQKAYRHRRNI
jgi:hypothetical protein